ncbi:hypothetical protein [Variovorax sp. WDL1]|uniref:hypothetical protein n=1 Tax=Variovorax sp. WDL1 TaxID=207745 RepID=UPI0011AFA536|nr:hypothetical protein [Variovorax sp. WDL1]
MGSTLRPGLRAAQTQRLSRALRVSFATAALAGVMKATGGEVAPPTSEEAQAAYSRFATAFVGRLISAGLPATLSGGKLAEINEFAYRQPLRGCDERQEPATDPFAPADAKPQPIIFNCTWENGERISFTRIGSTGTWTVSKDAAAAASAGMLLVGPQRQEPEVVAIPTVPIKAPAPEAPAAPPVQVATTASQPVFVGPNMQAMPSPFVPPARAEPVRSISLAPASLGPMPAPFKPN